MFLFYIGGFLNEQNKGVQKKRSLCCCCRTYRCGIICTGRPVLRSPLSECISRITGVMCSMAMRAAWNAILKQSVGDAAASTTSGLSPLRPYSAWNRSVCSVLVGRTVEGPPRITSTSTNGSSAITQALALQRQTRTRGGGHGQMSGKCSADG